MNIKELLGDKYMERFKVYSRETLFEPYWDGLLKKMCPLCGNKLKETRNKRIAYCNGSKHRLSPFFIDKKRLNQIELTYSNSLLAG